MLQISFAIVILRLTLTKASENETKTPAIYSRTDNIHKVANTYLAPLGKMTDHTSYYEEGENMLRVPNLDYKAELQKNKRRSPKKAPKRITQKIIKKQKSKIRKAYLNQMTSMPTQASEVYDNPMQEDSSKDMSTTQLPQRKKRRWNTKIARYPMPFQKLQSRRDSSRMRRSKRDTNRSDVYILQDLDEVEFLSHEKDNDIINVHVKKYW